MKSAFKKLNRNGLLVHSLFVMVLLHTSSAANLLFHMVMGRWLSPAHYAVLAALLGAFFILYTPIFFSIQNTMAHFSGLFYEQNRTPEIRCLVWRWVKKCALVGGLFLAAALACSRWCAVLFHLKTVWPVIWILIILFASVFMPLFGGAFQGMQRFGWMVGASNSWTLFRLLAVLPMVWLFHSRVEYAFSAQLIGVLAGILIGVCALHRQIPESTVKVQPLEYDYDYFQGSLIALFFFSILMNADIVMVKLFFTDTAVYGPYARASVIGRMIVFLAQPIASALFPKVLARQGMTSESLANLFRAILFSVVLVAGITGLFSLFPQLPLRVLFGQTSPDGDLIMTVRCVVWAMAPLSLVFLIMNFELAQNRFICLLPLGLCAALFVAGFSMYHPSYIWVAIWLSIASLGALAALIAEVILLRIRTGRQVTNRG